MVKDMSIKKIIWAFRYKRAIAKADRLANAFKCHYCVILLNGQLKVVPKQTLKKLVHEGRFKCSVQELLSKALYITK